MRAIRLALFALALVLAPAAAFAQQPPIVTSNPAQYAADVSILISRAGVGPLRDIYGEMFSGAALPANIEGALITYERAVAGNQATVSRVIEDVTLSGALRSIYTYHYFGSNAWLFVRFDFVQMSDAEWALSALAFSSEWGQVVMPVTPGFSSR